MKERENILREEINPAQIEQIVKEISESSISDIIQIKSGQFNTTLKIELDNNSPLILRIAPQDSEDIYKHEKELMIREYSIYPHISSVCELIPEVIHADFSKKVVNRNLLIQSYIEGLPFDDSSTTDINTTIQLWNELTKISAQISNATNEDFGFPEPAIRFGTWSDALSDILEGMIDDLSSYNMPIQYSQEILNAISINKKILNKIDIPRLVHGDLWPKNILFSQDKSKIVGVLDYERAFWGDPNAEWILAGEEFGGRKSKENHIFRCGLLSADFSDIPKEVFESLNTNDKEREIRNDIYLGLYLSQRLLESQRYPREEWWIEEEFIKTLDRLENY